MSEPRLSRRTLLRATALCALSAGLARAEEARSGGGTMLEFERALFEAREARYRHPEIDIIGQGFRPVGGSVADFGVAELAGRAPPAVANNVAGAPGSEHPDRRPDRATSSVAP